MGAIVPVDLQQAAALDRRPGVATDDDDAADRLELGRRRRAVECEHLEHAGHFQRLGGVEAAELAAEHRRAGDHRIEHAGQAGVDAELRGAGDDGLAVDEVVSDLPM